MVSLGSMGGGDGFNLGNARGYVDIDASGVRSGMVEAEREFDRAASGIENRLNSLGQNMSRTGEMITMGISAPIGAMGGIALKAAGDFDEAMIEIQARTGLTNEAMESIRDTAMQMGSDTVFSSSQAADAFLDLLTSGQSVDEALSTLPHVLNAAAAGGMELGQSADTVTDIMAAFNLEASDAAMVVDALSRASASSSADMTKLQQGFANVGPVARNFGMSVSDTAAALAVLNENGVKGAEAGTALRSMLLNMTRPTDTVRGAWNKLGLSIYDADGNVRDINTVLQELDSRLSELPVSEQNELMQTLAGTYGITALSAFRTANGLENMQALMEQQASASEVAQMRMKSFNQTVNSFFGSLEALAIEVMTPFMNNVLTPLLGMGINFANMLRTWASENEVLAQQIVQVLAGMVALGPTLFFVGQGLSLVAAIVGVLTSPLAAVAAAGYGMYRMWEANVGGIQQRLAPALERAQLILITLRSAVGQVWQRFRDGQGLVESITAEFGVYRRMLLSLFGISRDMQSQIGGVFAGVRRQIQFTISSIRQFGLREAFLGIFGKGNIPDTMESSLEGSLVRMGVSRDRAIAIVESLWQPIERLMGVYERVTKSLRPLFTELQFFFDDVFQRIDFGQLLDIGRTLLGFTSPLGMAMNSLRFAGVDLVGIFEDVVGLVTRFFRGINWGLEPLEAIQVAMGNPAWMTQFRQTFSDVTTFLSNTGMRVFNDLKTTLSNIWSEVSPALTSLGNWFVNDVMPQIITIVGQGIGLFQDVGGFLVDIWRIAEPHLAALGRWFLQSALPAVMTFISGTALPIINDLIGILTRVWTDVSPHLAELFNWFMNTAMPSVTTFLTTIVMPIIQELIQFLSDVWLQTKPHLANLYLWFITNGLERIRSFIVDTVSPVLDTFIELIGDIWLLAKPHLDNLKNWFLETGLQQIIDFVKTTASTAFNGFIGLLEGIYGTAGDVLRIIREIIGAQSQVSSADAFAHSRNPLGLPPEMRAEGGPVRKGRSYIVGERGEELFTPNRNGWIHSNRDTLAAMAQSLMTGSRARAGMGSGALSAAAGGSTINHQAGDTYDIQVYLSGSATVDDGKRVAEGIREKLGLKNRMSRKGLTRNG